MRSAIRLMAATMLALAVTPVLASPARACSCAMPPDIQAWVDESQAAFVGTLIDKHDAGGGQFGSESIYVFEVEEWVKGEGGQVIEVRSASDGASCGFEFWTPDQRIGAIIREENGSLRGDLCSQVEPDVLLAATTPPTPSKTGIGHLLIGGGWASSHMTVVDEAGHHVVGLDPPDVEPGTGGGTLIDVCPDGDFLVQSTAGTVAVWDLSSFEAVTSYPAPNGWVSDVSCRTGDASSIWVIAGDDSRSDLVEVVDGPTVITELPGPVGRIGTDFIVVQETHEGDAIWVALENGTTTELTTTPPDELRAVSVAAHPAEALVAVVETFFTGGIGPTTASLTIFDAAGTAIENFDIPWETYSPIWLDEHRVVVSAYDWNGAETSLGIVFDMDSGEMIEIEGWDVETTTADGDTLYGVHGGSVLTTNLTDLQIETLVALPQQSAGPVILLEDAPSVSPTTTVGITAGSTTPPLVVSELAGAGDSGDGEGAVGYIAWIAGGAVLLFLGILVWLGRRPSGPHGGSPV